jgi:hypothetical protein
MSLFLFGIKSAYTPFSGPAWEAAFTEGCNMSEESKIEAITAQVQNRRAFVKTAAKVAVTAPAAAMLLNASVKPASAQTVNPYSLGDDATTTSDDNPPDDIIVVNAGDDLIP